MTYLKSTTGRSYVANGKVIPANTKPEWLAISKDEFENIKKNVVIKGLIATGGIIVTDKEPSEMSRTPGALLNANGKLKQELADAKAALEKLKAEKESLLQGNEAAQALEAAQKELAEVKAELEGQKAKYEALDKEAKEVIADLTAKLANAKKTKKGQDE